ncbi:MAG: hypothetical protein WCC60_16000 [Ilumatobacteraceae bacterium]
MARNCRRRWPVLVLLLAVAGATVELRRRRRPSVAEPAPAWPPFEPSPAAAPTDVPAATVTPEAPTHTPEGIATFVDAQRSGAAPTWVAPVDGVCPEGFPIKANDNSGIFHVPGGRFYARTVPERCYAAAEDAEADGYRRAKA